MLAGKLTGTGSLTGTLSGTGSLIGTLSGGGVGHGIPAGGEPGQGLIKVSDTDYDVKWMSILPEDTASGAVASFPDGADDLPMGVAVDINPVQDLNGYDNPWPGGGGKNILDPRIKWTSGTYYGLTFTTTDGYHFKYTGTATGSGNIITSAVNSSDAIILPAGTYISRATTASIYKADGTWFRNQYSNTPFTVDEPFYVRNFYVQIVEGRTYDIENTLELVKGSTLPSSWTPYSNICPISGWTGAKVTRTGRNLLPTQNTVTTGNTTYIGGADYWIRLKAGTYTMSEEGASAYLYWRKEGTTDNNIIHNSNSHSGTFTLLEDCNVRFWYYRIQGTNYSNIQLETGSTAHAYEPYQGVTNEIPFSTEVYGGTLNVETGELKITSMLEVFDTVNNSTISSQMNDFNRTSGSVGTIGDYTRISFSIKSEVDQSIYNRVSNTYSQTNRKCNLVKHYFAYNDQSAHWYRNTVLYLLLPTALVGSTAESVFNYLASIKDTTPLSVMVELAAPVTLTLTPVEIRSLFGDNNLWADTGNTTVTYKADIQKYIDKKISAAVAAMS